MMAAGKGLQGLHMLCKPQNTDQCRQKREQNLPGRKGLDVFLRQQNKKCTIKIEKDLGRLTQRKIYQQMKMTLQLCLWDL